MSDIRADTLGRLIMQYDNCGAAVGHDDWVFCDDPRVAEASRNIDCSCRKLGGEWLAKIDAADPVATYLIAANERLHAEVQRLTDERLGHIEAVSEYRAAYETIAEGMAVLRSERDTLRADLATSEQTIAALKAQLQRVKEAAE